jgi:hypothetical protein
MMSRQNKILERHAEVDSLNIGKKMAAQPILSFCKIGGVIFLVWFLTTAGIRVAFKQDSGTLGDSFGAVNALFSGLALAGVVVAIVLQHVELEETRQVLMDQQRDVAKQAKRASQEEFDTRFFEVVRIYRRQIQELFPSLKQEWRPSGPVMETGDQIAVDLLKGFSAMLDNVLSLQSYQQSHCRVLEPALQMLEVAIRMLADPRSESYHCNNLRASVSPQVRHLFYHLILLPHLTIDDEFMTALEKSSFFFNVPRNSPLDSFGNSAAFNKPEKAIF